MTWVWIAVGLGAALLAGLLFALMCCFVLSGRIAQDEEDRDGVEKARRS